MRIPGWDSIDAAARWHKGFEIAGFIALGLLLLFEVLAYLYSNRKDTLVEAATRPHVIHVTSQRNVFQVAHNLGCTPSRAEIEMTSRGLIQWQAPDRKYDDVYLYLDGSADDLTADVVVWCR